ncbi:seven transmembrane MLO family protein [Actinidia rufa]|uniref:MLO-like protein n=1 Tax=Actinidia rufa TaxID=165716 RepID=A0A7J0HB82_9ERIC|nr:seven transmembrane MLO family protein [Actinidia rufa]
MGGGGEEEGTTLELTPTWVVAGVCTVIVGISLAVERLLHYTGKASALSLSLSLSVAICHSESSISLPFLWYLKKKDQKPLYEALQKIKEELMLLGFISLLLTVFQGSIVKMCVKESVTHHLLPCKHPPSESSGEGESSSNATETASHYQRLLTEEFTGIGYCATKNKVPLLSVEALHHLHIFIFVLAIVHVTFCVVTVVFGGAKIRQWKHWEDSIAKVNYDTQQVLKPRLTHVQHHDFIKGRFLGFGKNSAILSWLHSFLKQFYGSVTKSDYMALRLGFITLLLAVGTKLEHVISQLAHEVAEKHVAIEGELVVKPSDDHFWFHRPTIVLFLIHFILFQNAFEIAFFFWIWMGSSFKKAIFEDHVQKGLVGWAQKVKMKKQLKPATDGSGQGNSSAGSAMGIQLGIVAGKEPAPGKDIQPTTGS